MFHLKIVWKIWHYKLMLIDKGNDKMAEKDYYAIFENMENDAKSLTQRLSDMKDDLSHILEENAELKIENENLRKHLEKVDPDDSETLPESRRNLEKLYNEGYHVCKELYGKRRDSNEECMFCRDLIYGNRDEDKGQKND